MTDDAEPEVHTPPTLAGLACGLAMAAVSTAVGPVSPLVFASAGVMSAGVAWYYYRQERSELRGASA